MRKIHALFIAAILAIITACLLRAVFLPEEINSYENRYANQLPPFTVASYLEGTYQDGVEDALVDQSLGSESMKSAYHYANAAFKKSALDLAVRAGLTNQGQYVDFNGLLLFGDSYVTYWPRYADSIQAELDAKIASLNATFANHPELTFYAYYIEKDTDIDFETGVKTGLADALMPYLDLPEAKKAIYTIDSFEEFSRYFYKTDAHWNHEGSLRAYRQLVDLLGITEAPLEPTGDAILISDHFSGKKASEVAGEGALTESFYGFPYAFPDMLVTIAGQPWPDYGAQTDYQYGMTEPAVSYGNYYGGDNGETILSTGTTGRGNLLVVGESYDNPLLKMLASHYDNLYSVDLRYYEHAMGIPFDFTAYTQANHIDTVLVIGNIDFYIMDTFDLED